MQATFRRIVFLLFSCIFLSINATAQNDDKKWGLQLELGGATYNNSKDGNFDFYPNDDEGNLVALTADYYVKPRLAVTGGLFFEQAGILTDYASGIGLKKVSMMGLQAGSKFYFFPKKWVVQPHIGANLYLNALNLNEKGSGVYTFQQGFPDTRAQVDWNVKCPVASLSPRLGVDVHLLSSLSLTFGMDYRFPLGGNISYDARILNGEMIGQTTAVKNTSRMAYSLGLKFDFPTKRVSDKSAHNLLWLISSWIGSKAN